MPTTASRSPNPPSAQGCSGCAGDGRVRTDERSAAHPAPTGEPLTGDALPGGPVPGDPLTGDRLPALVDQAEALIEYGIHDLAQITPEQVRSFAADHHPAGQGSLLAVHRSAEHTSELQSR